MICTIVMPYYALSESHEWLKVFSCDFANWSGLSLSSEAEVNSRPRGVIAEKRPSLIEMRNYLFSRQCAMLLKVHKPWEVRIMTNNVTKSLSVALDHATFDLVSCIAFVVECLTCTPIR